ncbi:MAG: nitroreductase family protein [Spirochaetes bacterium]|nr:nitroreductase family protein [Spirochaetota bacterium]
MANEISFTIDSEKCTGCGACVNICLRHIIELRNNKALTSGTGCFMCGHCLAVCPQNAVSAKGCDDEIWEISGKRIFLDEAALMLHLKARRSIRRYKTSPVEKEKIEKIIEAGRLTPTGSNRQNVRYIVIQNEIDAVEDAVIAQYKTPDEMPSPQGHFVELPYTFDKSRLKRGFLFYNAPLVILAVSQVEINACLAAMNMELMSEALGLGVVYVGLFARPANLNMELRNSLGIAKEEVIAACLAIGYPDVEFSRTAPRKRASVTWR